MLHNLTRFENHKGRTSSLVSPAAWLPAMAAVTDAIEMQCGELSIPMPPPPHEVHRPRRDQKGIGRTSFMQDWDWDSVDLPQTYCCIINLCVTWIPGRRTLGGKTVLISFWKQIPVQVNCLAS